MSLDHSAARATALRPKDKKGEKVRKCLMDTRKKFVSELSQKLQNISTTLG